MSFGHFTPSVRFNPDRITGGSEDDARHRRINYDLCQGINMTKLSCVLADMVKAGCINEQQADIYHDQAGGLLALLCTENNRGHNV